MILPHNLFNQNLPLFPPNKHYYEFAKGVLTYFRYSNNNYALTINTYYNNIMITYVFLIKIKLEPFYISLSDFENKNTSAETNN